MNQHTNPATAPGKPHFGPVQLDAYPRLCGLPVTVERLSPTSIVPAVDPQSAERPSRPRRPVTQLVVVILAASRRSWSRPRSRAPRRRL